MSVSNAALIVPARNGCLPRLMPEVFKNVILNEGAVDLGTSEPLCLVQLSYFDLLSLRKATGHGARISEVMGIADVPVVLSGQDCYEPYVDSIKNSEKEVASVTTNGVSRATVSTILKSSKDWKPHATIVPADSLCWKASNNQASKALARTTSYLQTALKEGLGQLWVPLQAELWRRGAYTENKDLVDSFKALVETSPAVVICGLGTGESLPERCQLIQEVSEHCRQLNSSVKIVASSGMETLLDILSAIRSGVDVCLCLWPFQRAEIGEALVFPTQLSPDHIESCNLNDFIQLQSGTYEEDTGPIVEGCTCYTCKSHTRAYIRHLLTAHEMTAQVLLTIHNLHTMLRLFRSIEKAKAEHAIDDMMELYLKRELRRRSIIRDGM